MSASITEYTLVESFVTSKKVLTPRADFQIDCGQISGSQDSIPFQSQPANDHDGKREIRERKFLNSVDG